MSTLNFSPILLHILSTLSCTTLYQFLSARHRDAHQYRTPRGSPRPASSEWPPLEQSDKQQPTNTSFPKWKEWQQSSPQLWSTHKFEDVAIYHSQHHTVYYTPLHLQLTYIDIWRTADNILDLPSMHSKCVHKNSGVKIPQFNSEVCST